MRKVNTSVSGCVLESPVARSTATFTFANSCEYQSIVISDHAPVVLAMSFPDVPKANRHWHKSALLSDSKL